MVNKKKQSFKSVWKYFKSCIILTACICLLIVIYKSFRLSRSDRLSFLILILLLTATCCICFYFSFNRRRAENYRQITGRSYVKDKRLYGSVYTYTDLLDYFKNSDQYKLDLSHYKQEGWKKSEGIILGKTASGQIINMPSSGRDGRNLCVMGLPGSGKTTTIIDESCIQWGAQYFRTKSGEIKRSKENWGSVFCIDSKGDIEKVTHKYRNIKCFNLMNPKKSCHYNPFEGIENLDIDHRCRFIENIGFSIIPAQEGDNGKYFFECACDFWNGIALFMLHEDIHTSFPQVINAILDGDPMEWIDRVAESDCEEARHRLLGRKKENEKNLGGAWGTCKTACQKYSGETLNFLLGNDSSFDYISPQSLEDGFDVYIKVAQEELTNYGPLLSMITQNFMLSFMKRDHNKHAARRKKDGTLRPILLVLDEFAQLTALNFSTIQSAMMTLRGRNVSILIVIQSLSSLTVLFNSADKAKTFIDCISTFCFLSIQEVSTREWASKLIGEKKVLQLSSNAGHSSSKTDSSGKSISEGWEPIIRPAEFGLLPEKNEVVISMNGHYIRAQKQYWYK